MIETLKVKYPIKVICETLEIARSTYYDIRPEKPGNHELIKSIEAIIMKYPYYGHVVFLDKVSLTNLYAHLNPVTLRNKIDLNVGKLWKIVK